MPAKKSKKFSKDKPLTFGDLVDYTHEILFPAMEKRFVTKDEFGEFRDEMHEFKDEMHEFKDEMHEFKDEMYDFKSEFEKFKDESLTGQDAILKKLDILLDESKVAKYQYENQKKFFLIVIKALKDHKILNQSQLKQIAKLEIF